MNHVQKFQKADESLIQSMKHPAMKILVEGIARWRAFRGKEWLEATNQLPEQGKNLWSTPAILRAAGLGSEWITFVHGKMHFNQNKWTWFDKNPNGPDIMLETRLERPISKWVLKRLVDLFGEV